MKRREPEVYFRQGSGIMTLVTLQVMEAYKPNTRELLQIQGCDWSTVVM